MKRAFLSCSLDKEFTIPLKDLVESINEKCLKFSPNVLNFFLNILNKKDVFFRDMMGNTATYTV